MRANGSRSEAPAISDRFSNDGVLAHEDRTRPSLGAWPLSRNTLGPK